jgi:hypothetical protein
MSSFPSDISDQVQHSLAEFSIFSVKDDGLPYLGAAGRWLLNYADSKTGAGRYPRRKELLPTDMKEILPDVLILEPQVDVSGRLEDIIVRLIGSRMASFYGQVSGRSLRELSDPMAAQRGFECVVQVLNSGEPVVGVSVKLNDDLPYFQVTVLLIPLAAMDNDDEIGQVFVHVSIVPEKRFNS